MRIKSIRLPIICYIYNRYGSATASKEAVIEMRIAYGGKSKYMSTGIKVLPREWSKKEQRITNRIDAIILNQTLEKLMLDVRKIVYEMVENGNIDIYAIPSVLESKRNQGVTFLDYCDQRAETRKYGKAEDSQERYDRFLRFLHFYGKIKTFSDLTENRVMEMDRHLKAKKMKAKSRWNNYHRFLNSFIMDAQKDGLITRNPYDHVRIDHGDDHDGIDKFLLPEEFKVFKNALMTNKHLERVQDLFVFQTCLCMSYEDLKSFDPEIIHDIDGKKVLLGNRGKTKIEFAKPLIKPAIEVLKKYEGKLPIISNAKYNKYLKEVCAAVGIKKTVTTHWARHTGATLLLNAGVPIEVVSKVCGHSSIKMTEKIYAKMLPKTVISEVTKIEDKIL